MIKNKTGAWGEIHAARYLRDNGYKILSANYICRFGELDLVAEKRGTVCFVEVKTRNQNTEISPMEAVDDGKRERLRMTAKSFLSYSKMTSAARFDVCEVFVDDNDVLVRINYIENAF
ncbi:MAG: YraN family protein [Clostridia bacterium]|nr:YraN family protein [Clostridia bacterium]